MKLTIIKILKLAFSVQFLITSLPFILISMYVVPNLEDYAESIIPEVWFHVKFLYLTYDGRYFTSFLFAALNPLKQESYFLYKLIPVCLIILFFIAVFTFIKTFLRALSLNYQLLLSSLFMLLFLHRNPNMPYTFYYMISSYIYMLPIIMFIFFVVFLYKISNHTSYTKRISALLISMALCIAILGSNELLIVPTLIVVLFFLTYNNIYLKKNRNEYYLLLVVYSICLFVVFTSPGIKRFLIEESQIEKDWLYVWSSLLKTLKYSHIQFINKLSFNTTLLFSLMLMTLVSFQNKDKLLEQVPKFSNKQIIGFAIFGLAFIYLMIFPYVYAAGSKASLNYTQVFIIPYFFTLVYLCVLLILVIRSFAINLKLSKKQFSFFFVILSLGVYLSIFLQSNNIKKACLDLQTGEAKAYYQEVCLNIEKSKNNSGVSNEPVTLCLLKHHPSTIFSGVYFKKFSEEFHIPYKMFYGIEKLNVEECY